MADRMRVTSLMGGTARVEGERSDGVYSTARPAASTPSATMDAWMSRPSPLSPAAKWTLCSRLDEDATVNLVGSTIQHEHQTTGARVDAIRVEARHEGEVELGGAARCLATRLTHRDRPHPGSRCPALLAAAFLQGPVGLHAGHPGRPYPPGCSGSWSWHGWPADTQRSGTGKRHPFRFEPSPAK